MTCIGCVKRVPIEVWLPEKAYKFFTEMMEFDSDGYEQFFLAALKMELDTWDAPIPQLKRVVALLERCLADYDRSCDDVR